MTAEKASGHPAQAEHDQRAEYRFLGHADQYFDAAAEHRLDENLAQADPECGSKRLAGEADFLLTVEVKLDPPASDLCTSPGPSALTTTRRLSSRRLGRRRLR